MGAASRQVPYGTAVGLHSSRWHQEAPSWHQQAPNRHLEASKRYQEAPRRLQVAREGSRARKLVFFVGPFKSNSGLIFWSLVSGVRQKKHYLPGETSCPILTER